MGGPDADHGCGLSRDRQDKDQKGASGQGWSVVWRGPVAISRRLCVVFGLAAGRLR